jgi:Zn-dependent metalloprotease
LNSQTAYATNGNEDFSVTQQWTDELGKQHTHVSQTINGLNVYGTMVVHAVSLGKELGEVTDTPELAYVYLPQTGDTKLAWKMEVTWNNGGGDLGRDIVFFDAYNNNLLTRHAQMHSAKNWNTYTLNGHQLHRLWWFW